MKVNRKITSVDPLLIFQQISVLKKLEVAGFQYELSPYPMSLFSHSTIMLKTQKSKWYKLFTLEEKTLDPRQCVYIIDAGYLLHKLVWPTGKTFGKVCAAYVRYVKAHFGGDCTVVFDGYENEEKYVVWCKKSQKNLNGF